MLLNMDHISNVIVRLRCRNRWDVEWIHDPLDIFQGSSQTHSLSSCAQSVSAPTGPEEASRHLLKPLLWSHPLLA